MISASFNQTQIYVEYKSRITSYVRMKVGDWNVVDDLVADVFVKIYKNLDKFDPAKASIATWIYTITSRTVLDYYRSRRVHEAIPDENGAECLMPEALVDSREVDTDLLAAEDLDRLAQALEKIPEKERDLIILHYYSNVTLKDIADKMNMSYANAKVIHKKALKHLFNLMQ